MKLLKRFKPSKVLSRNRVRPMLTGAMVRQERVGEVEHLVLYATDAYCFLRLDLGVKEEGDFEGPIPAVALQHIQRGVNVTLGEKEIVAGITRYDRVIAEDPRFEVGQDVPFPRHENLRPEHGRGVFRVGINPTLLKNLADGMGSEASVILEFDMNLIDPRTPANNYLRAIKVLSPRRGEAEGLIMPIRTEA